MDARTRRRWAATLALAAGIASRLPAQDPPALYPQAAPPIEVYHGLTKVSPPRAQEPPPVVPASAAVTVTEGPRVGDALIDTLHALRDGTRVVSSATATLMERVADRYRHPPEPRQIVVVAPQPAAVAHAAPASTSPAQPTYVVVRDPAVPSVPAAAPAGTQTLTTGTVVAGGLGLFGLMVGVVAVVARPRRRTASPPAVIPAPVVEPPHDPNSMRLMGKYNAGPRPETAEQFEIGPTYHDDQAKKKQQEHADEQAAVQFILDQNLALLTEVNPEVPAAPVVVDQEGYSLDADGSVPAAA
jgi:hypothetical protein